MNDEQITKLARGAAKLAMQMLAPTPALIQVEASTMILKTAFMSNVKPGKRLELFDEYVAAARAAIVDDLNRREPNVTEKKPRHRRGNRRAHS